jgi:hypothetical protein
MATIRKRGTTWRAEVFKLGIRRSASFRIKSLMIYYRESAEDIARELD